MPITAATRLIALLGDPVDHSLSPRMQNAAFRAAGLDGVYLALRCDARTLPELLRAIATAGGAGNVTVPHKRLAATVVDRTTRQVDATGACNTFWTEGGEIHGDNTDVTGFREAVRALIGAPAGARALILGAGGAARAAVAALIEARADTVHLLNRTPARAAGIRDQLDPAGRRVGLVRPDRLDREGYDLVVNATPLGLDPGDPLPLDLDRVARAGAVLDLVYSAERVTAWVAEARRSGLPAADGTAMLLHQGMAAFERWWQQPAPGDVMSEALTSARPV